MRALVAAAVLLSLGVAHAQPVYTLRDGGSGTSNNTTISTDSIGLLTGSATSGVGGLALSATSSSTMGENDLILLNPTVSTIQGEGFHVPVIVTAFAPSATLDTSSDQLAFLGHVFAGTWDLTGESGMSQFSTLFERPVIRTEPDVDQQVMGFHASVHYEPQFIIRGGECTMGDVDWGHHTVFANPIFTTQDGGTLHIDIMGQSIYLPRGDAGVTVGKNIGYLHSPVSGAGAVTDDIAFMIDGGGPTPSGVHASLYSLDVTRNLFHAGPAYFGAAFDSHPQTPTPEVGLEVSSTDGDPRVMLAARLSDTGESNITTPVAGMEYYNTDRDRTRQYDGTGWVSPPGIVDTVDVTAQTSDIPDTSFANAGTPGLYRVSYYLQTTTADAGAGSVALHVSFTDDTTTRTLTSAAQALTATTDVRQGTFVAKLASGDLEYGVANTGGYATAAYALTVTAERLN